MLGYFFSKNRVLIWKEGFTLIEILVVMAIIGIIGGLLIPIIGSVREQGHRILCLNNMRQHSIAWNLYLGDHNDCFPPWGFLPKEGFTNELTFAGKQGVGYGEPYGAQYRVLNKYLDIINETSPALSIVHCPNDSKRTTKWPRNNFDQFGNSYFANARVLIYYSPSDPKGRPLAGITRPRDKLFLEMCYFSNVPGHGGKGYSNYPNVPVMVLFIDGHISGPFYYDSDFEWNTIDGTKKVLSDPNGSDDMYD